LAAILLQFEPLRPTCFLLHSVIAVPASGALQPNVLSHGPVSPMSNAERRRSTTVSVCIPRRLRRCVGLFDDLGYHTGADRSTALADSETEAGVHGNGLVGKQFDFDSDIVARHAHLDSIRELDFARYVRRAEVELRPVAGEEGRMPAAFLFGQHI